MTMSQADCANSIEEPVAKKLKVVEQEDENEETNKMKVPFLLRIRTVTAFLSVQPSDFQPATLEDGVSLLDAAAASTSGVANKVSEASKLLKTMEKTLTDAGYEVQTLRLVTNPFGQWMTKTSEKTTAADDDEKSSPSLVLEQSRLDCWNQLMEKHGITFCSVGSASNLEEIRCCPTILESSPYISCSAHVASGDVDAAKATAKCIQQVATLPNVETGLGNFRFCMSNCKSNIPFFPAAKSDESSTTEIKFALGLENGRLAQDLLRKTKSIHNINTIFREGLAKALLPTQQLCQQVATENDGYTYLGIDTSLNPSLDDDGGSVAEAIELLDEIDCFGGPGTIGAAAAITTALQSLPGIQSTGYCGLMLPVCEDQRLAALAAAAAAGGGSSSSNSGNADTKVNRRSLEICDLLSISSACGVGIDTVPLAGDVSTDRLASLLLDVAGLAERWDKSLSCRVLPFAGKKEGQRTDFDSPYMVNTNVFSL